MYPMTSTASPASPGLRHHARSPPATCVPSTKNPLAYRNHPTHAAQASPPPHRDRSFRSVHLRETHPHSAKCCASSPHGLPAPRAAAPASRRCAHPRCSTRAPAASAPLHIVATSAPRHPHQVRHVTPHSAQEQANSKHPPRTPAIPNKTPPPASTPLPNVLFPFHCYLFTVH